MKSAPMSARGFSFIMMKNIFFIAFILILSMTAIHGQTAKKLTIRGLRIFSEDELYSRLNLKRFDNGKISVARVVSEIENFYKENGYILVKVYSTNIRSDKSCDIFVDEGRLGKIIIHNISSLNLFKFKRIINIPERIYNKETVNQNFKRLQKKFPRFDITANVLRTPDYESNIIQLDREFRRLRFLGRFDFNFLAGYRSHNDLHFFVSSKQDENSRQAEIGNGKIEFKLHYNFPSTVIPQIHYSRDRIFFDKDYFRSVFSIGYEFDFMGLINKDPSFDKFMPHQMNFAELRYEYKVGLIDNDFFGPLINGRLYRSHTSRDDLGIVRFDYSFVRTVLAPEFTLLNNLNIYAGLGTEELAISNSLVADYRDRYLYVSDTIEFSAFTEVRLKFDPIKIYVGNKIDRYVILTYTSYFYGSDFKQLEFSSIYETEFDNFSVLSFSLKGFKLFGNPQFYRSEEVSDKYFFGFRGKNYYTNSKASFSSEYRFSIYRDFVYAGAFFDSVLFKPEGYIISGTKFGMAYGPTVRLLVYDQYQFIVYYGYDILYPDKHKGVNFNMRFSRVW